MRGGHFWQFVRLYLGLGAFWCLMTNLLPALTGGTSPVTVAAGANAGGGKLLAVALGIGHQILFWPSEVYQRVILPRGAGVKLRQRIRLFRWHAS